MKSVKFGNSLEQILKLYWFPLSGKYRLHNSHMTWFCQVTAVDPAMESAISILEKFAEDCVKGKISKRFLRHGVPWRHPPRDVKQHRSWAKIQLLDYIQAMADTDFAVISRAPYSLLWNPVSASSWRTGEWLEECWDSDNFKYSTGQMLRSSVGLAFFDPGESSRHKGPGAAWRSINERAVRGES